VSIAAEIIGERWGGSGRRLTETAGAIHAGTLVDALVETGAAEP
jgi:xanthine dehydrogenase accessory factor